MSQEGAVTHIQIKGFKSIKETSLELRPLNVLIGANGAGKSNFIGVFTLLNQIRDHNLDYYVRSRGGADRLLHFGQKETESISIRMNIDEKALECHLFPTIDDNFFVAFSDNTPSQQLLFLTSRFFREVTWKIYHFQDTSDSAKIKKTCNVSDTIILQPDASNIAAILYHLKGSANYQHIINSIQLVAPFFHDFILEPEGENNTFIRLRWKHRKTDAYFDVSDFSDGTLRFICLATLLLLPKNLLPSIIIIDEPELGLHPHAIYLLAELLKSASKQTQVIITTQSVSLVNQFVAEDIIVVDTNDDSSIFRRVSEEEVEAWLVEYGMGDIWEKNILGGSAK